MVGEKGDKKVYRRASERERWGNYEQYKCGSVRVNLWNKNGIYFDKKGYSTVFGQSYFRKASSLAYKEVREGV